MADYTSLYTGAQIDLSVASGSTTTGHISGSSAGTGSFGAIEFDDFISGSSTSTGSFGRVIAAGNLKGTALDESAGTLYATDLVVGEDAQTALNFETANEIHFDVNNSELVNMVGSKVSGSSVSTGSFGRVIIGRSGQLIEAGGQTITAGGQTITAGGQTVTAGGITVVAGNISASYTSDNSLGILGTHRAKTFGTHANGQTVHLSASGGTILQSTDDAVITLPATKLGLKYTFIHAGAATEQFDLSPNASDKIMGSCADSNAMGTIVEAASNGAGADNKDLTLDAGSGVGDRVTLVADGASGWYITECVGSWAFES